MTEIIRRRPGRPAAQKLASTDGATTVTATAVKTSRRRRVSVGGANLKLEAPLRPGFVRRWVNDDGNRIADATALAYDYVADTDAQTSDIGSRTSRLVGTKANGEPLRAYLMETPAEEYAYGVAEREEKNAQIDQAILAGRDSTGKLDNQYGHGEIKTSR